VAYAVVSAIPFNNTLKLSAWWLKFFHYQAALVMVLVDMFITPKLVAFFSDATGMRRSMLLMAARLGTMWLAAVLSTFYLTTHCMNGWTHLWKVAGLCWALCMWRLDHTTLNLPCIVNISQHFLISLCVSHHYDT
jgi:hypothetical protein